MISILDRGEETRRVAMTTCGKCGSEARLQPISRYQLKKETVGGMHVEVFEAVQILSCEKCGVLRTDIPNLPGLMSAVAVMRCNLEQKLNGREIRFLRKAMDNTAKELASHLDTTEETVSRWENDKQPISNPFERMLRVRVCRELGDRTGIDWNDDHILYQLKIPSVSTKPIKLGLSLARRKELWREKKAA
jgi:transcriptional regulator with XRE-family HTH domain